MNIKDVLKEYGAMAQLDKMWSKPVGSQQHLLKKSKKKKKTETKEAPKGTYFTKSGNLVRGRLTKAAKERGARETDPKDKSRSKVPPVTQTRESDFDYDSGKPKPDKNTTWKKIREKEIGIPIRICKRPPAAGVASIALNALSKRYQT